MIWKARNDYIFNSVIWSENDVLSKALFDFNEFTVAKEHVNTMRNASTTTHLLTLSSEKVLLYVDAGLDPKTRKASIGMVALKANGDVLYAYGSPVYFAEKAIIAEALAIRKVIQLTVKYGWKNIHILSDSLTMVQMLNGSRGPSWEVSTVCEDIWALQQQLIDVYFKYLSRGFNTCSHKLAKFSFSLFSEVSWFDNFPIWIVNDTSSDFVPLTVGFD
ncbi:uncharacterized protein LOC142171913 [Nicotiana tabacum]|uniref:Uncharacterized protein LOC142171913 n=1 Tax=Nicotiana tabacum TaxID=4097 RepID=A0AC58T3D0_TOBAC